MLYCAEQVQEKELRRRSDARSSTRHTDTPLAVPIASLSAAAGAPFFEASIRDVSLRSTRTGSPFLVLDLEDGTGRIRAVAFGHVATRLSRSLRVDDDVFVRGGRLKAANARFAVDGAATVELLIDERCDVEVR